MILHLFVGDMYVEKVPSGLKFLKLLVKADTCREHGIASDLFLSENIVRFNQTMHFPVGGEEIVINELEVCLIGILNDSTEKAIGFCQFICTSGEHSITKSINLHDARGVMVGKVPITSFYYQSAIKLGDKVMFKPMYEPTAKEYAFLLSRRIRSPSKSKPVTFDRNIEHQLNNEARDLISRDFTIVSAKNLHKKTGTVSKSNKTANHNDTLTYNPGMTRNGAMSDAVRGRTKKMSATASKARTTKPAAEAPKLRPTYMSVGYVKEKQWPERNTGEAERNLFRLQQASEMKLQILKDIAQLARQRNARTQARQDAIRRKKTHVQIQEGKIKKVLAKKESEIQLLKGTLTHLRLSNALRNDAATPIRTTAATKSPSSEARSFSRLRQLVYPDAPSSILKRSVTPNTSRSGTSASRPATPSLRRPASVPHSGRRGSKVSFSQSQAATPSSLYRPLGKNGPYDSRHKPSSQKYSQARTPQHELVDQLSEAFDLTFEAPSESGALEPPLTEHGVDSSQVIAKDWLANARASINEFHRPVANQNSFIQQHSAVSSTHSQMNPSVGKSDSNGHRIHQIPAVKAQFSSNVTNHTDHSHYQPVTADISSSSSEEDNTVNLRLQQKAEQMPSFLNSLLETRPNGGRELDTTVSSIAVGDIPYFPATVREDSMRQSSGAASPIGSEHSSDSLENLSVPLEPAVPTARWPSRGTEENISHPRRQSWNSTGTGSAMSTTTQTHSNTALKRLERNQQYSAMLLQQQKQEEMQEQQHREEALAKQNYNIRPQPGTSGSYAVRPSSVSKQTIADQLRKNRAYDTPTGTRNTRSVPQEDPKSTATEYRSAECGTEECSGLSNSLEKNITDVTNTVQALQGRVRDLARQSEEDAVPRGWVRRSVSEASGQSNKVSTSSVNLPNPQSNDGAVLVLPAGEEGAERKPMLMAEDDIKLVFEDASSSSGEFDSVSDKHSTVR